MFRYFLVLTLCFGLSACSTISEALPEFPDIPFVSGDDEEEEVELEEVEGKTLTAIEFYTAGKGYMDENRYQKAIESFQEIERVYPFDKLSAKAQVIIAYANYKDEEYGDAVSVIDKFLRLNPGSKDAPYMYYLKGLAYYDRIADIKRDQKVTELALSSLKELVTRYPDSDYSRDAKLKIDLVNDHLAGKHMEIGRFYLKDKKFIAAINRFKKVVEEYEATNHIEEALYRLTESYLSLGLLAEAKKNASVLGHNYPEGKWYHNAYALIEGRIDVADVDESSWIPSFNFGGAESAEDEPLPKENVADSWFDKLVDSF